MCLTVPCRVIRVDGLTAQVSRGDRLIEVSLALLDEEVTVGDWLAVQAERYAQSRMTADEAQAILALYDRIACMLESETADVIP
jgi:hydrogenase expression/formation protein HypC